MFFSKQFLFGLHLVLLFHSKMALSVDSNCRNQEEELAKLKAKLTVCQMSLLVASTRNSDTADVGIEFVSTTEEEEHVETTSNTSSDYVEYEAMSTSEASGSVLQLEKDFDTENQVLLATTETSASALKLDCGGVIELSEGYSTTVEYKVDETYGNNEFCMWGITSARRWGSLSVVIESHGLERCCDGVLAYYLNSTSAPGSVGVERCDFLNSPDGRCVLKGGIGFLVFSSDGSNTGMGFRATISHQQPPETSTTKDSVFFFDGDSHTFRYPSSGLYKNMERVLTLLQVNRMHQTQVTYLSSEANYDYLWLYTIYPKSARRDASLDGRYSGTGPSGPVTSQLPQIALFLTDYSTVLDGFRLSWGNGSSIGIGFLGN